jgi:hypothetical protein
MIAVMSLRLLYLIFQRGAQAGFAVGAYGIHQGRRVVGVAA